MWRKHHPDDDDDDDTLLFSNNRTIYIQNENDDVDDENDAFTGHDPLMQQQPVQEQQPRSTTINGNDTTIPTTSSNSDNHIPVHGTTTTGSSSSSSSSSSTNQNENDIHTSATTTGSTPTDSLFYYIILHPTIFYILIMETAERFAYYGFRAILILYLIQILQYSETTAIAMYGYNSSLSYLTPLLGAYCADSYFGNRYTTIWCFSLLYLFGLLLLTIATTIHTNHTNHTTTHNNDNENDSSSSLLLLLYYQRILSLIGLCFVCIGTGGIKPCVSSFGADQLLILSSPQIPPTDPKHTTNNTTTSHRIRQEPLPGQMIDNNNHNSSSNNDNENDTEPSIDGAAVRVYFNYFYFCINIGAITSIAIIPYIRIYTNSFTYAFGTSLLCMIIALCIFLYRRKQYIILQQPTTTTDGKENSMIITFRFTYQLLLEQIQSYSWIRRVVTWSGAGQNRPRLRRTHSHNSDVVWDDHMSCRTSTMDNDCNDTNAMDNGINRNFDNDTVVSSTRHGDDNDVENDNDQQQQMEDARQILHILPILATFPIYSCLYDQQGSVWTIQATHMYVPPFMQPEQMNMINPLLIMIFIPLFDQIIYPYLQNRCQISIAPLRLMSWGMFLTAMAFTCSGFVDSAIEYHNVHYPLVRQVHVMWQLPQITLLAVGEIFLSVTGLEFAYSQSPLRLKAFVTALYLSTTGIGDLFAGILYSTIFSSMKRATVMHICALMMLCNLRMFILVARWYETTGSTWRHDSYVRVATLERTVDIEVPKIT